MVDRLRIRPERAPPVVGKLLRKLLARKPQSRPPAPFVYQLHMTKFVKEHVVEQEPANGDAWPLRTTSCPEFFA
jgi:hypothetical protein